MDSWNQYISNVYGQRNCTLEYVDCEKADVPPVAPTLLAGQPHSEEAGSVNGELARPLSHNHALYQEDNAAYYSKLEEALWGSRYEASIKPFKRSQDGRGTILTFTSQHSGRDKWIKILADAKTYANTAKWNGSTSITLEDHIDKCHEAYVSIETAALHVTEQVPNKRTRVQSLLDSIDGCTDSKICSHVANINDDSNTMHEDWEASVAYLLPVDPVAKQNGSKQKLAQSVRLMV